MRVIIFLTLVALALFLADVAHCREADVGVWLARSCIGEAGWDSEKTGECAALLHIYKKRSVIRKTSILKTARRYSAAIKGRGDHPRPWLLRMDRSGAKPKGWPPHLRWDRFSHSWLKTIALCDLFLFDLIADPIPQAMHYGARIDRPDPAWTRLITPYRNLFYAVH